ncbi:MAG: hypothetical protein QXX41_12215, partial [Nitrososphaerota archaeon]
KLNEGIGHPDFHIVPSKILAKKIREEHRRWLEENPSHKDNPMRTFSDENNEFKDKWDLIIDFLNS